MFRTKAGRLGPLVGAILLAAGCGSRSASVSGEVTYDGQPVGDGMITFLPADGKGPATGGKIIDGRYTVANLPPGPKVVQIEAVKAVPFARTSEEMAHRAAANRARGDGSGIIDRADVIPANAEGNHRRVDIQPGSQTLHFHLKKPGGST